LRIHKCRVTENQKLTVLTRRKNCLSINQHEHILRHLAMNSTNQLTDNSVSISFLIINKNMHYVWVQFSYPEPG